MCSSDLFEGGLLLGQGGEFAFIVIGYAVSSRLLDVSLGGRVMLAVGLSLFLTMFVMSPVLSDLYQSAIAPYVSQGMPYDKALALAEKPIRAFMLNQTREDDIAMFMEIARNKGVASAKDVPFTTLVPAFLTSELKSAFTIG